MFEAYEKPLMKQMIKDKYFPADGLADLAVAIIGCYEDWIFYADTHYFENPRNKFEDIMCFINDMGGYWVFDSKSS